MTKNVIAFIIALFPVFLFLQGCQENTFLPVSVNTLQAPSLLYPPDDTSDIVLPITLSWTGRGDAKNYRLQVSTDSAFNDMIYDFSRITSTNSQIDGLNNSTKYYWRINATGVHGTSRWSSTWNFTIGKYCPGLPTVTYLGKTYNTVQIRNQCWLRENLDIGTMILRSDTAKDNGIIEKYCYHDSIKNCNIYGGLYQWWEAMQYSTAEGTQGICPDGWHIPTYADFRILDTTVMNDGNALKAIDQGIGDGTGTNTSGFSALFAGTRYWDGDFTGLHHDFTVWSSTQTIRGDNYYMYLWYTNGDILYHHTPGHYGLSIRCLKD